MWRLRSLVVLGVLTGVLVFGASITQGAWYWNAWYWNAWYWNANGSAEGVNFTTAWNVVPAGSDTEIDGDELNYHATIEIRVPKEADFTLIEQADTETVKLKKVGRLECKVDGIEAEVIYRVKPLEGALGDVVKVWASADEQILEKASGDLKDKIELEVLIPSPAGASPDCYHGDDENDHENDHENDNENDTENDDENDDEDDDENDD